MKINYNVTGEQRKELVGIISETIGMKAVYAKMPTCNYIISNITVEKDGTMVWDERTDEATIQQVTEALAAAGFEGIREEADGSCGIHVHVGADKHDARSLLNLVKIFRSKEDMLYKALAITGRRECTYTKKVNCNLADRIEKGERPANMNAWEHLWYESQGYSVNGKHNHYNETRYHGLNLHATFSKGTVEFRLFNGTTHAGKIKAYVQFCLAVSALAINSRSIKMDRTVSDNEKYTFRCWLLRLGLIGDEFKTCRIHMMANLQGCSAWRHGQAA